MDSCSSTLAPPPEHPMATRRARALERWDDGEDAGCKVQLQQRGAHGGEPKSAYCGQTQSLRLIHFQGGII